MVPEREWGAVAASPTRMAPIRTREAVLTISAGPTLRTLSQPCNTNSPSNSQLKDNEKQHVAREERERWGHTVLGSNSRSVLEPVT